METNIQSKYELRLKLRRKLKEIGIIPSDPVNEIKVKREDDEEYELDFKRLKEYFTEGAKLTTAEMIERLEDLAQVRLEIRCAHSIKPFMRYSVKKQKAIIGFYLNENKIYPPGDGWGEKMIKRLEQMIKEDKKEEIKIKNIFNPTTRGEYLKQLEDELDKERRSLMIGLSEILQQKINQIETAVKNGK